MPRRLPCLVLCSAVLALSGCFSLSREAPAPRHYVLGSTLEAAAVGGTGAATSAVIGLRTPRLSDYLASPFVVVRQGTSEIGFSRFDLWGEGLAPGLARSLAGHMRALDPELRIESAPWAREARPELVIELQVVHFEGVAPEGPGSSLGQAHLLAHWEILRPDDRTRVAWGTTEVREPGWTVGDVAALVTLLDAGLATLAEALVQALESHPGEPAPGGSRLPPIGTHPSSGLGPSHERLIPSSVPRLWPAHLPMGDGLHRAPP